MAADPVAWFIGGGAIHSPEIARMVLYAATRGGNGVVLPTDLKVLPLAVPGTKIRVTPGAFVALSRFANVSHQSYGGRFPTETEVDITETDSFGPRSDMLIARVKDPQYPPFNAAPPVDRAIGPYVELFVVEGVSPTAETAAELNLGYPAVELARIDMPQSTGTVEAAYIKPLRKLVQPRTWKETYSADPPWGILTQQAWTQFPNLAPEMMVPEWATTAFVKVTLSGLSTQPAVQQAGQLRAELGGTVVKTVSFQYDNDTTKNLRETLIIAGTIDVTAWRGTKRAVRTMGSRDPNTPGNLGIDSGSQVIYEVEFSERVA